MSHTAAEEGLTTIDMTGQGEKLRYVEIRTDAGLIRVNTNLVTVAGNRRSVVVEFAPLAGWSQETNWKGDVSFTERRAQ